MGIVPHEILINFEFQEDYVIFGEFKIPNESFEELFRRFSSKHNSVENAQHNKINIKELQPTKVLKLTTDIRLFMKESDNPEEMLQKFQQKIDEINVELPLNVELVKQPEVQKLKLN